MNNMMALGIFKRKQKGRDSNQKGPSVEEWPDYVVTLEGKNFNEFIQKYPLSMVDFWAPWCAPCRVIAPRIRRLSKIYKGKVAFGRLNIQNNEDITKQYHVMGIPHLVFFRYGGEVTSVTGARSIGKLKDNIDGLLKKLEI
jgi:thioredoxin 1